MEDKKVEEESVTSAEHHRSTSCYSMNEERMEEVHDVTRLCAKKGWVWSTAMVKTGLLLNSLIQNLSISFNKKYKVVSFHHY